VHDGSDVVVEEIEQDSEDEITTLVVDVCRAAINTTVGSETTSSAAEHTEVANREPVSGFNAAGETELRPNSLHTENLCPHEVYSECKLNLDQTG
jgi:hypothetical protein